METWKDIAGFEGLYQISNLGRIRSLDRITVEMTTGIQRHLSGKLLNPTDNGDGYRIVSLKKGGKRFSRYIHRLVAEAFVDKPEGCNVVNHIDYNKGNNIFSNLEWCTQKANVQHSSSRLHVPHKSTSSTGEKYVTFRKKCGRYRVNIKNAKADRQFKTIEEAIAFRNEVLNEFSISK